MKSLYFLLFLLPVSTEAAEKLLDCNIANGDTQQVTVVRDGRKMKLIDLTMRGSLVERELTATEWKGGVLKLWTRDRGSKATLTRDERGDWFFLYQSLGFHAQGYADCWINKP
jgi:hypothetical protein